MLEIVPRSLLHDGEKLLIPGRRYSVRREFALAVIAQDSAADPAGVVESPKKGDKGKEGRRIPYGPSGNAIRVRVRAPYSIAIDALTGTILKPGVHWVPIEFLTILDPDRVERLDPPTAWTKDGHGARYSPIYRGVPAASIEF